MKEYLTPAKIKSVARVHMFGRYGVTVRAYIWMNVILLVLTWLFASMNNSGAGSSVSIYIFYFIRFILLGIFMSGSAFMYLNIASGQPAYPGMVFYGFRNHTDKSVVICLALNAMELIVCVPMIALFIMFWQTDDRGYLWFAGAGALIAAIGYIVIRCLFLPAYFLIHDFPDYGVWQIITLCPGIMKQHFGRALYLYLSFIPMAVLEIVSLGAAAPWVQSYLNAALTEMYLDIMRKG